MSLIRNGCIMTHLGHLIDARGGTRPFRTVLLRETKTMWIDHSGQRWRKKDGAIVPHMLWPRYQLDITSIKNNTDAWPIQKEQP